ncbi:MAG: hypothetical protein ACOC3T_01335 [Bacteroidota bacterium]
MILTFMDQKIHNIKNITQIVVVIIFLASCSQKEESQEKYTYRGWNFLSNNKELNLEKLDSAAAWGVNHIELTHYQLCHDLKDMKDEKCREDVNYFTQEAHKRGIENVYVWDHAFYNMDYYPDKFKVKPQEEQNLTHHTTKFEGGIHKQLDLDNPEFWQWVYNDYDSLLALVPEIDGVVLTFIETGSYVIYQHSEKAPTHADKIAMLVDSLANYFINEKGLGLTIRTFIYNQFEKESVLNGIKKIKNKDIKVMMKMVPHDWFLTYPYQDYVQDIPFPVVIEYDCGMEYAGENIIANSFPEYFTNAFKNYDKYDNVIGFCARTDRFETTSAIGTPGEINLWILSQLAKDTSLTADELTTTYLTNKYGEEALPFLKDAYIKAYDFILSTMYTMGTHIANHSRLNFHRQIIYSSHTTGEWYDPDNQIFIIEHGVNKTFHYYKDILNKLSFPAYKTDTASMCRDICWVMDSGWLDAEERMDMEFLNYIINEKDYGVALTEDMMNDFEKAKPYLNDHDAKDLYHTFNRSVIFAKERRGAAKTVYGYRLWNKGEVYQTEELKEIILGGLNEAEEMLNKIDNYPVYVPEGQWRWIRDREAFSIYKKAIMETGWPEVGLYEVVK